MTRPFHITIGVTPSKVLCVQNELRLVKAALLYGDKATLCSPSTALLQAVGALGVVNLDQQINDIKNIAPVVLQDKSKAEAFQETARIWKQLRHKKFKSKEELLWMGKSERVLRESCEHIRNDSEGLAHRAGSDGITQALGSGLLELHHFSDNSYQVTEDMTKEFIEAITNAVLGKRTYPLFDDNTGNLVKAGIAAGAIPTIARSASHSKSVGLANELIQRLPLFECASISEILDIRRELDKPLVQFRATIMKFSEMIENAAWDADFPIEADEIFYKDITPAVQEIEEAVKSNSYIAAVLRRVGDKYVAPFLAGPAALAVAISPLSSLPETVSQAINSGAWIAPTAAASAGVAFNAYQEWKQKRENIEKNDLFFYYQAGKRLS
jgi:hypothetical protein